MAWPRRYCLVAPFSSEVSASILADKQRASGRGSLAGNS